MKFVNIEKIKDVLAKLISKKEMIENNYFQSLLVFNNMLKVDPNNDSLVEQISKRKETLDESVNSTILYLDNLIRTLTLVVEKVIRNKEFSDFAYHEGNRLSHTISPDDLDANYSYEKGLRNLNDNNSLSHNVAEQEAMDFAEVSNEFNDFLDFVNKEYEYTTPTEVKQGLLNDQEYSFDDKISKLEDFFKKEFDSINLQNQMLRDQNINLHETINKIENNSNYHSSSLYNKRSWDDSELYFSALDKSVNTAVEKFDYVSEKMTNAINILSINQIESLEKISLPLIKSLETALKTLTSDFSNIKKENEIYRKQLDDYKTIVNNLKFDYRSKEFELKTSYESWLNNVRKISELEEILNSQSDEIKKVYEEKNDLINRLEDKIYQTNDFVNQVVYEKELLIQQNNDLFKQVDDLKKEISGENQFDDYIKTISIEDLVEKEANKIVESKIELMIKNYKDEVEKLKSDSLSYFMEVKDNDERILEKIINEKNADSIESESQKIIKNLEKKLENIEHRIKVNDSIKEKTEDTINDLNQLLGEGPYSMIEQEKSFLSNKFDLLEKKIFESLERVKILEDDKANEKNNKQEEISNDKLDSLFVQSPLYEDFSQRLVGKEIEINALKAENYRILEENEVINNVLNETIQKITINSSKMKEIENLLTKQDYEFMILNDEKNNVIDSLYKAIKDRDLSNIEKIEYLKKLDKYDFSNFAKKSLENKNFNGDLLDYIKQEVEKLVSNEINSLKNKYQKELEQINIKYENNLHGPVVGGIVPYIRSTRLETFKIDDEYFNLNVDENLKKEIDEYLSYSPEITEEKEIYEEILSTNKDLNSHEFIGEGENILDVTIENDSPWNIDVIDDSKVKVIHEKISINKPLKQEEKLIKKLSERNNDLEDKIKNLQNIINDKFDEQSRNNKNIINELTYARSEPIYYIDPSAINISQVSQNIKNDLLSQQIIQSDEIDKKIRESMKSFKEDNDKELSNLNRKIDSLSETNINNTSIVGSIFDTQILEDKSSLYLEREIINSTDKLLQLQKELLSLENEIIIEEKKVIVEL